MGGCNGCEVKDAVGIVHDNKNHSNKPFDKKCHRCHVELTKYGLCDKCEQTIFKDDFPTAGIYDCNIYGYQTYYSYPVISED